MVDLQPNRDIQCLLDSFYWWHSIDLGNGITTNGTKPLALMQIEYGNVFDHLDLAGRTVLDVGAWNGGFSVEAWRRGASSITGLDHWTWNHPDYRGRETFDLISEITGANLSAVDRDLDDPRLDLSDIGQFDIVLFLGVFYHLKNPLSALREVSNATKQVLVLETYVDSTNDDRPLMIFYPGSELAGDPTNWWGPNTTCVTELLKLAGFPKVDVREGASYYGYNRKVFHAYRAITEK